jgi:hypothetical protein
VVPAPLRKSPVHGRGTEQLGLLQQLKYISLPQRLIYHVSKSLVDASYNNMSSTVTAEQLLQNIPIQLVRESILEQKFVANFYLP